MGDPAAALPPDHGGLLVVDDEPFLREAVAASLRFLGFEVTTAQTGAEALRLARDRPFDLVVLDVMLPDTDGFEVVTRLRREGCRVPVIFLTARDTEADKVTGLTLGGDDYLTKPFGLEELAARVRTVLRRTRPHRSGIQLAAVDTLKKSLILPPPKPDVPPPPLRERWAVASRVAVGKKPARACATISSDSRNAASAALRVWFEISICRSRSSST